MSDIDFDELDRAVSKYVGSTSSNDDASPVSTPPSIPEAAQESVPVMSGSNDNSVISSSTALPKRRSSGRFMDVVHPSSDMGTGKASGESEKSTLPPSSDIKRTAPTLEPLDQSAELDETPSSFKDKEEVSDENKETEKPTHEWPDPITVGSTSQKEEAPSTPTEEPPLFLPNAKVEKRPLGGVPKDKLDAALPSEEPEMKNDVLESSQDENKANAPEPELPPELEKDLVAIEAGEAPEIPQETEKTTPSPEVSQDEKPLSVPEKKDEAPRPEPTHELLATGSIPQQYKTPPIKRETEAAEPDHPAFLNADHYEKAPATTPAKPKSKAAAIFQWIFIILGLLFLGGTLGAAFFVFVNR